MAFRLSTSNEDNIATGTRPVSQNEIFLLDKIPQWSIANADITWDVTHCNGHNGRQDVGQSNKWMKVCIQTLTSWARIIGTQRQKMNTEARSK